MIIFICHQAKVIYETKKLDPNVEGSHGETGLHLAARAGFQDCVCFLLEAGADVNRKGNFEKKFLEIMFCCDVAGLCHWKHEKATVLVPVQYCRLFPWACKILVC